MSKAAEVTAESLIEMFGGDSDTWYLVAREQAACPGFGSKLAELVADSINEILAEDVDDNK